MNSGHLFYHLLSQKRFLLSLGIALVAILLSMQSAHAAVKTWDGGGAGDTNMSTAANWDANTLPSAGDILTFDATSGNNATWDSSFISAQDLQVHLATGYTGTVTLSSSTLTIASTTVIAGTLNVGSNSLKISGPTFVNGGTVTSTFSAGTMDFDGGVDLDSGTLQLAATVTAAGDFAVNSGTFFDCGEGHCPQITFDGAADQEFTTGGAGEVYGPMTLNNSGGGTSDDLTVSGNLTIAGTFTITLGNLNLETNNAAMDLQEGGAGGSLTLADAAEATMQWGSGAITVSGNITVNDSATMSSGSATLTLDGDQTAGNQTIDFDNQSLEGGLTINKTAGNVIVASGQTLTVGGTLTITSSTLDLSTNNAVLNADGAISVADNANAALAWGSGAVTMAGNLTQNGAGVVTPGSGTLTFDGTSAAQTVSSTAAFQNMTINNTGGIVIAADTTTLDVNGAVTITSSTLDLSTNNNAADIEGLVTVSSNGTLQWGTSAINHAGSFTQAGGTVTHGSGAYTFDGSSTSTITVSSGSLDLGAVDIDSDDAELLTDDSLTISSLTIGTGSLFQLNSGSTLTVDGTSAIFAGDGNHDFAEDSTVILSGGSATNVTGGPFGNLTVNGSTTYTLQSNVTVEGALSVSNVNSTINVNNNNLTVTGDITNTGEITQGGSSVILKGQEGVNATDSGQNTIISTTLEDGMTLYFRVVDQDENLDAASAETVTVTVTSQLGDSETVTLTETTVVSETFTGSIIVDNTSNAIASNSILEVSGAETLSIAYTDNEDGTDTGSATLALKSVALSGDDTQSSPNYPQDPSISIDQGNEITTTQTVTLSLGVSGASEMLVSEDPTFANSVWEPYVSSKSFTLSEGDGVKTVYAKFANSGGFTSVVVSDTIELASDLLVIPPSEPPANEPVDPGTSTPAPGAPVEVVQEVAELSRADLIKTADVDTVYYYGVDGKRHAFPSQSVYATWYGDDFSGVRTVSQDVMSAITLGANMTVRPGTKLIKLTTVEATYAIGTGSKLHWIKTEELATALYGDDWADRVIDVSDAMFVNYDLGEVIDTVRYPNGAVVIQDDQTYFVEGGMWRMFANDAAIEANAIPELYRDVSPAALTFVLGSQIVDREEMIKFPTGFVAE